MTARVACLLPALALVACLDNPLGPTVPLGREFELQLGESARVATAGLDVTFESVLDDSRCPTDVVCVAPGEARIRVQVGGRDHPRRAYTLRTEGPGRRVVLPGYVLELRRLDPRPSSSGPIPPGRYRGTFRMSRGLPSP